VKILISSHAFAPSIGGIETVSRLLAQEFIKLGEEVMVVTQTPGESGEKLRFPVMRRPSLGQLWGAVRWCDLFWQNNLSLRTIWPAWLLHRPVIITHQGSYCRRPVGIDLAHRLKLAIAEQTPSVAPSRAVAACFRTESPLIPNPYDTEEFRLSSQASERALDLVFVGRLVTEKGVDLMFEALGRLKGRWLSPSLTIIGDGPERAALEELTARLGLREQVSFAGTKRGADLAEVLHRHKVMVVPSRYAEPFGVVALEGIACGCLVVGSSGGGLPEAIGPCGLTFPNGDGEALAATLEKLLLQPNEYDRLRAGAASHLAQFKAESVAQRYLTLFRKFL